jgi:hypothetical protein
MPSSPAGRYPQPYCTCRLARRKTTDRSENQVLLSERTVVARIPDFFPPADHQNPVKTCHLTGGEPEQDGCDRAVPERKEKRHDIGFQ